MRHFRQILSGINVAPLLAQVAAHPELWNSDDSWTRHKSEDVAVHGVDVIVLRYNFPTPRGQQQNWDRPALGTLAESVPIVLDVMHAIPGEHLGKVLITRMRPGDEIKPHTHNMQTPLWPHYYRRYQIPLAVEPGCLFHCGSESLYMEPGTAWGFDDIDPLIAHSVVNGSGANRISMLADIRPWTPTRR